MSVFPPFLVLHIARKLGIISKKTSKRDKDGKKEKQKEGRNFIQKKTTV
jgi:hypothetical protein